MANEDRLDHLLVQWGESRIQGQVISEEELCVDCPELVEELCERTKNVQAVSCFINLDDDDLDVDFLHLPDFNAASNQDDEIWLPECSLTIEEFDTAISDSGLMEREQVQKLRKAYPFKDAQSFARHLVTVKKLTRFQARVLLEERKQPLFLDRYIILDEIGSGGMGAVFKALHTQMDRIVALKILPKAAMNSSEKVRRFQREVRAAAKLEHSNIVTAFDAHESKGIHYLVMSYISGSDLAQVVRKQGPLPVGKAVKYITQAARGLEHAHNQGICHRDVKPANLLLDNQDIVKILDLGLAQIKPEESEADKTVSYELTQAGMVMGTVSYIAPEQALDTRNADARSDIYSLGCTLYYLLTGRPVYSEDTTIKTIMAHQQNAIPSLCQDRSDVPKELDAVFQKMVAKNPDNRYQSMTSVISALQAINVEAENEFKATPQIDSDSQTMYEATSVIDNHREVMETKPSSQPSKRRGFFVASCLLGIIGLVWGAGILFKVDTPEGTIILEIDQPELAGAVVSVDDQKKITIKTPEETDPIVVVADQKTHTLKVTKGGFETFTEQFTVKAGKQKTIKVRLEPLGDVNKGEPKNSPATSNDPHRCAVEMILQRGGYVSILTSSSQERISELSQLPSRRFALYSVVLSRRSQLSEADWKVLGRVKSVVSFVHAFTPISGAGLKQLKSFSNLLILDLNKTQLTDAGVTQISELASIRTLTLGGDRYLTNSTFDSLVKMSGLRRLNIGIYPIRNEGLKMLSQIPQLNILSLHSSTGLQGSTLAAFQSPHSLRVLDLSNTDVDDDAVQHLKKISSLEMLNLGETKVSNEAAIRLQKTLPNCSVIHSAIPTNEADLRATQWALDNGGVVTFDTANNSKTKNLNEKNIPQVQFVVNSITFKVESSPIAGIENLVGLRNIRHLAWPAITNSHIQLSSIGKITSLGELRFPSSNVSATGLKHLKDLTQLEQLNLGRCKNVSDDVLEHFSPFKHLWFLDLHETPITDKGLIHISKLRSLRYFYINGCINITDSGLNHLISLTKLNILQLSNTFITDDAIPYLQQMKNLRVLYLTGTKITPAAVTKLQSALPECVIFHESLENTPWQAPQ